MLYVEQIVPTNDISTFETIKMTQLHTKIELAKDRGQYLLIFDRNENANVYFQYKATSKDFHKLVLAVQIGKKDKEEAMDTLRKSCVYSMRAGDTFCINVDKLTPDFKSEFTDDELFPTEQLFDPQVWHEDDNYMSIVHKDENYDLLGNKDLYSMHKNYQLVILSLYQSDADMEKVCAAIPHSEKMKKIIIEKQKEWEQSDFNKQQQPYNPLSH